MSELHKFSFHCLKVAKKLSEEHELEFSKSVIDIPGLADANGASNTLEYPVLTGYTSDIKFMLNFTYKDDQPSDIAGSMFKTPWLRVKFYIKDIEKQNFYRIYRRDKSFINTLLRTVFFTPGVKLIPTTAVNSYYYMDCITNKKIIIENIQRTELLTQLDKIPNLKMVKVSNEELVVHLKCEDNEHYSEGLVLEYIDTLNSLMHVLLNI